MLCHLGTSDARFISLHCPVPRRTAVLAVVAVALIAAGCFTLGVNHARFLTCEDFILSGNALPHECVPAPTSQRGLPSVHYQQHTSV
jgi:hypothetical protein